MLGRGRERRGAKGARAQGRCQTEAGPVAGEAEIGIGECIGIGERAWRELSRSQAEPRGQPAAVSEFKLAVAEVRA